VFQLEHVPIGTGATLESAYEFYLPILNVGRAVS
jgi:hypothetical protein